MVYVRAKRKKTMLMAMRSTATGQFVANNYSLLPSALRALQYAQKTEGGDMTSLSLRHVLKKHYEVDAGYYSYGSLLIPGHCDRGTTIGPYASIGPNVRRFGASHPSHSPSLHPLFYNPALGIVSPDMDVERSSCDISADVWIGANVVILPGCRRIGVGAIVGASSVVTKDVPDFSIAVGIPARVVSYRFDDNLQSRILASEYWKFEPLEALSIIDALRSNFSSTLSLNNPKVQF